MLSASVITFVLAAASCVSALPTLLARQESDPCANLGGGAFSSAASFKLAALNSTDTNQKDVGVPLVIGQNGSTDSESYGVLSTYASYPYSTHPTMTLQNGVLVPNSANSSTPGTDTAVSAGDMLGFVFSDNLPAGQAIYCGVADTDPDQGSPFAVLAVNGDTNNFSLCSKGPGTQNSVVYEASASSQAYDFATCYAVQVQLLNMD